MDVGLRHLRQRIRQGDTVSAEVLSQQSNLVERLRAAGRDSEAQDISEGLRTARFVQMMAVGDPKLDVLKQTEATMPRYITVVQNFCKLRWPMRRVLLDHLGRASSKAGFKIFKEHGGSEALLRDLLGASW